VLLSCPPGIGCGSFVSGLGSPWLQPKLGFSQTTQPKPPLNLIQATYVPTGGFPKPNGPELGPQNGPPTDPNFSTEGNQPSFQPSTTSAPLAPWYKTPVGVVGILAVIGAGYLAFRKK
jgi:hypothetical protein